MNVKLLRILIILAGLALPAATASSQEAKAPLTNEDVISMVAKGFSENIIVGAIQANEAHFDVSMGGLTVLKEKGVSNTIMDAMLAAASRQREDARAAKAQAPPAPDATPEGAPRSAPANASDPMGAMQQMMSSLGGMGGESLSFDAKQLPTVTLNAASTRRPLQPTVVLVASGDFKGELPGPGSSAENALAGIAQEPMSFSAINSLSMMAGPASGLAMSGMTSMGSRRSQTRLTHVLSLAGPVSKTPLTDPMPKFEFTYSNEVGVDPQQWEPVLLMLVPAHGRHRLVGATRTQLGKDNSEAVEKMTEARVPIKSNRAAHGGFIIEPQRPLAPGEYGLVLRPSGHVRQHKGNRDGMPESNAFFSIWDFTIATPDQTATQTAAPKG